MQRHLPIGYKIADGKIAIVEEEAEVVRKTYVDFTSGVSMYQIAKEFTENGMINANGKVSWNHGSIGKILQNCKYVGDEYYPSIVSEEIFDKAQKFREEKIKRLNHGNNYFANNKTNTYPFSGKIICGECGANYKRYTEHHSKNNKSNWKCKRYIMDNKVCCKNAVIDDAQLEKAFITVMNKILRNPALLIKNPNRPNDKNSSHVRKVDLEIAQQSDKRNMKPPEIARLLFLRASEQYKNSLIDDYEYQTSKLKVLLENLSSLEQFEESLFKEAIKHITIYKNETLWFEFINGVVIDATYKLQNKRGVENAKGTKDSIGNSR